MAVKLSVKLKTVEGMFATVVLTVYFAEPLVKLKLFRVRLVTSNSAVPVVESVTVTPVKVPKLVSKGVM